MRYLICCALALVLAACQGAGRRTAVVPTVVIAGVTLIDGTDAGARPERTVVIEGERIAGIHAPGEFQPGAGAVVIDGRGKFLIPGLWDMHTHAAWPEQLPLYVANGVTGIRVMWGNAGNHQQAAAGATVSAPRMFIGTPLVDGPTPVWPGSIALATPADARRLVTIVARSNAKFIKVYSKLPRDVYFALADEAVRRQVEFSGHVPTSVSFVEASVAGQATIEHLSADWLTQVSTAEAQIRAASEALQRERRTGQSLTPQQQARSREILRRTVDSYSDDKALRLARTLAANGTWLCPTAIVERTLSTLDDPRWLADPRLQYVVPEMRRWWDPRNDFRLSARTAEDWSQQRQRVAMSLKLLGVMHRANVRILAGSDTPNPYTFPGFGLHDELELLVEAGLSPLAALQAATRNAAEYMRRAEFGTVEVGKVADLVLLDANPLEDIRHTRGIAVVVVRGRVLARGQLDDMLHGVRRAAARRPLGEVLMPILDEKGVAAAAARFEELLRAEPDAHDYSGPGTQSVAGALYAAGRTADLLAWVRWSAARFPLDAVLQQQLGDLLAGAGDVEGARGAYRRTLELAPGDAETLYKLELLPAASGERTTTTGSGSSSDRSRRTGTP